MLIGIERLPNPLLRHPPRSGPLSLNSPPAALLDWPRCWIYERSPGATQSLSPSSVGFRNLKEEEGNGTRNQMAAKQSDVRDGQPLLRTVIFAISSNSQSASFDRGKAQPNGFTQSRSVDVGDPILVADSSIRKIEALSWYVAVWVRRIVRVEPDMWLGQ